MTELPANLTLLEAAVAISRKLLPRPPHLTPGWCAAVASILEATARKPGNVTPDKNFTDLSYDELCKAARAMVPAFDQGKAIPLG
ncbi:MAG: triphosphoribosyl-dephospho-CoA synthase, partial [Pirellulales bacterium]